MKVIDVLETDGFSRQEISQEDRLVHLFRFQQSRVRQFLLYCEYFDKKYGTDLTSDWFKWLPKLDIVTSASVLTTPISRKWFEQCSQDDKNKYLLKFRGMVAAKDAYEKAGGRYDGWKA